MSPQNSDTKIINSSPFLNFINLYTFSIQFVSNYSKSIKINSRFGHFNYPVSGFTKINCNTLDNSTSSYHSVTTIIICNLPNHFIPKIFRLTLINSLINRNNSRNQFSRHTFQLCILFFNIYLCSLFLPVRM